MYIRRDCLKEVGDFDAAVFPGYGEENDFCMRARERGWRHVLAADVFVQHRGAMSYGDSHEERRMQAEQSLLKLHPQYSDLVRSFVLRDPARLLRQNVDIERLRASRKPLVLFITHGLGGGADKSVNELIALFDNDIECLLLKVEGDLLVLSWRNAGEAFSRSAPAGNPGHLLKLLRSLAIKRIHVHHLLGMPQAVRDFVREGSIPFDFTVHDFFVKCPRTDLSDCAGQYCGEPDENGCNACLRVRPRTDGLTITQWRDQQKWLIEDADRVIVPSDDAAGRLAAHFPEANFIVAPHADSELAARAPLPEAPDLYDSEPLRIAVIGALSASKGADVLESCAVDAINRNLPLEFHLIGYAYRRLGSLPQASLLSYGPYDDKNLPELIRRVRPHIIWFPAQCPETYSYTLSASLNSSFPIVATDIGSFPERLYGRRWTWIMPWYTDATEWNDFFLNRVRAQIRGRNAPDVVGGSSTRTTFLYKRDYLKPLLTTGCDALAAAVSTYSPR